MTDFLSKQERNLLRESCGEMLLIRCSSREVINLLDQIDALEGQLKSAEACLDWCYEKTISQMVKPTMTKREWAIAIMDEIAKSALAGAEGK